MRSIQRTTDSKRNSRTRRSNLSFEVSCTLMYYLMGWKPAVGISSTRRCLWRHPCICGSGQVHLSSAYQYISTMSTHSKTWCSLYMLLHTVSGCRGFSSVPSLQVQPSKSYMFYWPDLEFLSRLLAAMVCSLFLIFLFLAFFFVGKKVRVPTIQTSCVCTNWRLYCVHV